MAGRPLVEVHIRNVWHISRCFWVLWFWMIFPFFKLFGFWGILGQPGNHASQWIGDLWLKDVSLIFAYFQTFVSFSVLDDFVRFSINSGFGVFFVHPTVVSVLLSSWIKRCFFSRMQDFLLINRHDNVKSIFHNKSTIFSRSGLLILICLHSAAKPLGWEIKQKDILENWSNALLLLLLLLCHIKETLWNVSVACEYAKD